jgi:hypothetical protein
VGFPGLPELQLPHVAMQVAFDQTTLVGELEMSNLME